MITTLGYYIDEVRNSLPRDWKNLDTRLIIKFINTQRAIHLKNEFNKPKLTYDAVRQTILVTFELRLSAYATGTNIHQSTLTLPKTIVRSHNDTIIKVRSTTVVSEPYNYILRDDALYAGSGRTNATDIFAFLHEDYLYLQRVGAVIATAPAVPSAYVEGVFEDPVDVYNRFGTWTGNFDFRETPYPMDDITWGYIKDNVIKYGVGSIQGTVEDKTNDMTELK